MFYIIVFIYYQSPWKQVLYFSNHSYHITLLLFLKELCIVCHINLVGIRYIISTFLLIYKYKSAYYCNANLYGCVSPHRNAVQYISTLLNIKLIIYIGVLYYWCMPYVRCRGTLSNGCGSPHWNCTLHGYSFYVYTIVVLSYTGAFRLVLMVLNVYVSHTPGIEFTCVHYNIDINFKQKVVICQMGAFRPIRCTQHGYKSLITRDGL